MKFNNGHILKFLTYKNLTAGNTCIIDQGEVTKDSNMTQNI